MCVQPLLSRTHGTTDPQHGLLFGALPTTLSPRWSPANACLWVSCASHPSASAGPTSAASSLTLDSGLWPNLSIGAVLYSQHPDPHPRPQFFLSCLSLCPSPIGSFHLSSIHSPWPVGHSLGKDAASGVTCLSIKQLT